MIQFSILRRIQFPSKCSKLRDLHLYIFDLTKKKKKADTVDLCNKTYIIFHYVYNLTIYEDVNVFLFFTHGSFDPLLIPRQLDSKFWIALAPLHIGNI